MVQLDGATETCAQADLDAPRYRSMFEIEIIESGVSEVDQAPQLCMLTHWHVAAKGSVEVQLKALSNMIAVKGKTNM